MLAEKCSALQLQRREMYLDIAAARVCTSHGRLAADSAHGPELFIALLVLQRPWSEDRRKESGGCCATKALFLHLNGLHPSPSRIAGPANHARLHLHTQQAMRGA